VLSSILRLGARPVLDDDEKRRGGDQERGASKRFSGFLGAGISGATDCTGCDRVARCRRLGQELLRAMALSASRALVNHTIETGSERTMLGSHKPDLVSNLRG
jgi:hypothetical protein